MIHKADIIPLFVEHLACPGANALKQEILSLGGEAAVHKHTIDCQQEFTDVLLLGTMKHYRLLIPKLRSQYWKLRQLSADLKILLGNIKKTHLQQIKSVEEEWLTSVTLNPTLDLASDLRKFPLLVWDENSPYINLSLAKLWPEDKLLIRTYLLALQSKGYQVIVQPGNEQQKTYLEFLENDIKQ